MSFDEILHCTAGVGVLAAKLKIFLERPERMKREFEGVYWHAKLKIFHERPKHTRREFAQFRGGEAADVLGAERDTQEAAGGKEPQKGAAQRGNSEEFLG